MSDTFPVVRKGYDPEAVDSFVKSQAEAWRAQLEDAVTALEEWQERANAMSERASQLERRIRDAEAAHDERVGHLESSLAELRWAHQQVQGELAELNEERDAASQDAAAIVGRARDEAARIVAAADEEAQKWFAAARRRIEMAEAHADLPPE